MSGTGRDVWVYVEHLKGQVAGHTYELLGKGSEVAAALGGRLVAVLAGSAVQPLAATLGMAESVLCVEDAGLAGFTPEGHATALRALAEGEPPRLVLVGATSEGMDLAALLAAWMRIPLVVNCREIGVEGDRIVVTSQMCGGKLLGEMEIGDGMAILTVLPGAFPSQKGISERTPGVRLLASPVPLDGLRTRFTQMLEPEAGDVDITRAPVLIAVGRGIQRQDNIPLAEALAMLLGGEVCASRPVIDQGWLPLTRQVGKSGMIVKPKLYLALGISGAPEHVEGMKDSDLIIAINADPRAPIFDVADYGVTEDMFELLPALTEELEKRKAQGAT